MMKGDLLMKKATIVIDSSYQVAKISERLFGSFIEHLGRAVYDGIYEPNHPLANDRGFRTDVIELVKALKVPIIRYPGGNFVSNFFWEDSVGPLEGRKTRLDLAWRTLEPNKVGLDEFYHWTQAVNADMMMAVNLGTRGVKDALNLLEYCNLNTDSYYANMRRSHGIEEPYHIKLWCLGNEMDGEWQIGKKTMEEYGRLSHETAKAMKMMDPSIELVSCGSSFKEMPTFPEWEAHTLMHNYDDVDYISLHQYYGNLNEDSSDYLAQSDDMDAFIKTVIATCDYVKAKKRSNKTMYLSFDEWNVWFHSKKQEQDITQNYPWQLAPHLLEEYYTFEDALMVGLMIITLMNHADRVKIACLAQLVNVLAPVMTEKEGKAWRQTIYFPFMQASQYGKGILLHTLNQSPCHQTLNHGRVTDIESTTVYNEETSEVTLFIVNRNIEENIEFEADIRRFKTCRLIEHQVLSHPDLKARNSSVAESVVPESVHYTKIEEGYLKTHLIGASWHMIRLKVS